MSKATAEARANIALIKYWGRTNHDLNLPFTSSLSLTVDRLVTTTTVEADPALREDTLVLNGKAREGPQLARVARHLDHLRKRAGRNDRCRVVSENAFPDSAGLASSASGFAALTIAGLAALGARDVSGREASSLARLGSGSAARSLFGGFVEWHAGATHDASYAEPVPAAPGLDLHDVVVILEEAEKKVGSSEGHGLAETSPLHSARIAAVPHLLDEVRAGVAAGDVDRLGRAAEQDALLMHAVMMTSHPSLLYWSEGTLRGLHAVREWRASGLRVYATIDAGPNLHLLCPASESAQVARLAEETLRPTRVLDCGPGAGARLLERHLI